MTQSLQCFYIMSRFIISIKMKLSLSSCLYMIFPQRKYKFCMQDYILDQIPDSKNIQMFKKKSRKSCQVKELEPRELFGNGLKITRAQTFSDLSPKVLTQPNKERLKLIRGQSQTMGNSNNLIEALLGGNLQRNFNQFNYFADNDEDRQEKTSPVIRDDFSKEQLEKIFKVLSNDEIYIQAQDLLEVLEQINQLGFKQYEMIRMLDKDNKGFISLEQFVTFFENGRQPDGHFLSRIPERFRQRAKWKKTIEQNYEILLPMTDLAFCEYIKQIISQK